MRKIIIFLFISIIVLNQILPQITLAQGSTPQISLKDYIIPQCGTGVDVENQIGQPVDEEVIKECASNYVLPFENLKQCVNSSGVNMGCIASLTNRINELATCLEDAVPDFGYMPLPIPGVGKGGFDFKTFIEMLRAQLIMEGINSILGSVLGFISGLFGKVSTDDKGAQNLVGKSIEETAKNVSTQLETGIKLGLQDAQEYFKFKLKSTLESLVYNKIIKNFIPDIQQYRNLRMYQAYTRAIDELLKPFTQKENITCLPFEVKACVYTLLNKASAKAQVFVDSSKNPKQAKRIFRSIARTNRFSILNKPNCDPSNPETFKIYQALGLNPSIMAQKSSANLTAYIKPTESILAKAENKQPKIIARLTNFLANPFNSINLKNLLGQIASNNNKDDGLFFNQQQIANQAIEMANCNLIFNSSTEKIFAELEEELSTFNAYSNEPGGTTFMPKTSCLQTDAEAKSEIIEKQLKAEQEKDNPDQNKINSLQNTLDQYRKIAEQQRKAGITGESTFCIKKDEVKNPIATYEELRGQISSKNTFDFLNKISSGNVFVSFIRGWISSNLFKFIDKGFADFNKESNQEMFTQNNADKIYEQQLKDCERLRGSKVAGLDGICRNVVLDNRTMNLNMVQFNSQSKLIEIQEIIKAIPDLETKLNNYSTTITEAIATITSNYTEYLDLNTLSSLDGYNQQLIELLNRLNNVSSTAVEKFGISKDMLNKISEALNKLKDSPLAQEINSTTEKLNTLSNKINEVKQKIQNKLNKLQSEANNPKVSSLFSIANYNPESITPEYRGFNRGYYYDRFPFNIDGVNSRFVLGKSEKLSFYNYFYPKLVNELAGVNLTNFYTTTRIHFRFNAYGIEGESVRDDPKFIIADIASKIFAILYNVPQSAASEQHQKNLMSAVIGQLNNFFSNQENATFTPDDLNQLGGFFTNLDSVASRTLRFINQNSSIFPENDSFTLIGPNNLNMKFDTRETFENLLNISSEFKKLFDEMRNNDIVRLQTEINELNNQIASLTEQYQQEVDNILRNASIDPDKIDSLYKEVRELNNEISEIDSEISSLCNDYNNLIIELEASINARLRNISSGSSGPPPDEESGGGETGLKNNLGKILALALKNITANIFETINFLKPKRIDIK
ncbi:MAG: hypothetical protein KatS3mg095_0083 [Candidatus Parcubacteria bacterium]|nr:MAG: hypothetical protein KatS3mg095_0083 [Candidatus Parcubacteria bacterium]